MAPIITMPRIMAVGGGALAELPGILERLGLTKPLDCHRPFSGPLRTSRARRPDFSTMPASPGGCFPTPSRTRRPPSSKRAPAAAEDTYDSLVAVGGGSSIDTAKGMSVLSANGGRMRDYKVPAEIPNAGPPIVAIPTTAGTGSEVTRFTVITDTETDEKMLIAGLACCPSRRSSITS